MDREPTSIKVGISIGDINGIGVEIIIKSLKDNRILNEFTPVIYGSSLALSHYKKTLEIPDFSYLICKTADDIQEKKTNVLNCIDDEVIVQEGISTPLSAKLAIKSLEKAAGDLASGKIDVLVTAPLSKESVQQAGFEFPGHTEFLAEMAGVNEALMLLVSPFLKVALVTSHVPLKDVPALLTKEKIIEKIHTLEKSLTKDFGISRPKIAVLGLNPHAGENGKLGLEEQEIISPAIQLAKNDGSLVYGPYAADGFFGSEQRSKFDGVLAMYHDQGLAAFKALSFEEGVNFTAGLPIVRTSPDHGTAFDIAGKNMAEEQSMRSAIYLAIEIYKNRKFEKEISQNPLAITVGEKDTHNSR